MVNSERLESAFSQTWREWKEDPVLPFLGTLNEMLADDEERQMFFSEVADKLNAGASC